MKPKTIAQEALDNYKLCVDSYAQQLEREIDDLKFQVPEKQWDYASRRARGADQANNEMTPARPMLSIPKLDQPIQLVLNQERTADLGVNIHPLSEDSDEDTAQVLQGLYRNIERESNANVPRGWGFHRAVLSGRGYYRIITCYDESSTNPFDQKILLDRINYQDAVQFDPSAKEADFSDAEFAFISNWMPIETFNRLYPKAQISTSDPLDQEVYTKSVPDWVKFDGDQKAVLVSEYFKKVHKVTKKYMLDDGTIKDGEPPIEGVKYIREYDEVTVMWYKLAPDSDGLQVLEEQEWNGKYIPIVPVIGRELQPFDAERCWTGIVGPAKDAQKMYNYAASTAIEIAALEPKAPWIGAEGQFEGHEAKWNQSNTRNFPYLEYKPVTIGGEQAPPPQRVQIDVSRLGPSMHLLQQADDFIQSATATPDAALGELNSRDRSGKAIKALQGQSEAATSHYLHNLAQISMKCEAKIILDMIPRIYDRPGRVLRILDMEDKTKTVMFNAPHVNGPNGPQRVDMPQEPGAPPVAPQYGPPPQGTKPINYDLRKGIYGVSVTIGKGFQTRMEQGANDIGQILESAPQLMPLIAPVYFKFRDFPGAKEIADVLSKVRDKQFPNLQDDANPSDPEFLKSKLQEATQQIQMMDQQLKQAAQQIQTDQAKQQAVVQKAQIDSQAKVQIAQMETGVQAQNEQLRSETEASIVKLKGQVDLMLQVQQQQFERQTQKIEQSFERMMKMMEHRNSMSEAVISRTGDREDRASEREDREMEGKEVEDAD